VLLKTWLLLDNWTCKVRSPFFAAPIADMFNLLLSSSVVPKQLKEALISPTKDSKTTHYSWLSSHFHHSCSLLSHTVNHCSRSTSLQCPPPGLIFKDQFAFCPTSSTTAVLIQLIHEVTAMLESNPYVIIYDIYFSKAFDTMRHSELLGKYSKMELPDCVYNWLVNIFRAHTHCSRFSGVESEFISISASGIQSGRGTVLSIVYCRCTYWCPETNSWKNNLTLFTILYCVILLWAYVWTVIHTSWAWC